MSAKGLRPGSRVVLLDAKTVPGEGKTLRTSVTKALARVRRVLASLRAVLADATRFRVTSTSSCNGLRGRCTRARRRCSHRAAVRTRMTAAWFESERSRRACFLLLPFVLQQRFHGE